MIELLVMHISYSATSATVAIGTGSCMYKAGIEVWHRNMLRYALQAEKHFGLDKVVYICLIVSTTNGLLCWILDAPVKFGPRVSLSKLIPDNAYQKLLGDPIKQCGGLAEKARYCKAK